MQDCRFDDKKSKNFRTIDMYVRFCEGKTINKAEEAQRFGVDERSIQRDIDDIRAFLDERKIGSKDTMSDGTLWEVQIALYFRWTCLPDCAVSELAAGFQRNNRRLS